MKYYAKSLVWIGLVALLKCQVANAAVHNISQGQLPICNNWNNSWSISGSTYTCSASVSFVAGDEYVANSPITLRADAGITLSGNKVGTVTSPITLQTTYGTLNATVGSSVVYGNLSTGSGALTLTGVSLTGNIQTSAKLTITQSAINGNVSGTGEGIISGSSVSGAVSFGNGFTGSDTTFASSVSSTVISLKNGSVSGSITGTNITLNGTNVDGKVTGTGTGSFTNLTIGNSVSMTNGLIATNTVFSSTLTSTNGAVTLFGGLVTGLVNVSCCKVTVSQGATIFNGIVAGNNGIDIRDSTVTGDLKAGNNPIVMVNVNMTSGTISPGNNSLTITGGTVTADVTNAHRVFINDNAVVTGDVLARYEVSVSDSKVVGDIATVVGHDGLHHVYLNNSEVYGNVTVRDDWGTINGDESSRIYGVCTYKMVDPISLCEAGGGPSPIDPVECDISLEVGPMIAGKSHIAKVIALDEPVSCEVPSSLNILFDYKERDGLYHNPVTIVVNGKHIEEGKSEEIKDVEWEEKEAELAIEYKEAGKLYLAVLDAHDEVLDFKEFVSSPAGICISPKEFCSMDDGSCHQRFRAVGDRFEITITPVAFKDGDICAASDVTKNYRRIGLEIEPYVVLPSEDEGGERGILLEPEGGNYDHLTTGDPNEWEGSITKNIALSEVGVFRLYIKEHSYLGSTVPAIESKPIGRFYPTYLKVEGAGALIAGCGSFSYQDQSVDIDDPLTLNITGYGRNPHGEDYPTKNYDHDEFWGFKDRPAEVWLAEDRDLDISPRLSLDDEVTESGQNDFDGKRTYTWTAKQLSYDRAPLPTADDLRFFIRQRFSAEELTDKDDVCYDLGTGCKDFEWTILNSEFRLGQLRSENLIVPHGNIAKAPIVLEHWNGTAWQSPVDDNCTSLAPPTSGIERLIFSDDLTGIVDEPKDWNQSYLQITATESEPQGRVLLRHMLRSDDTSATWLCRQRSEDNAPLGGVCTYQEGGDAEIRSSITFGIYKGSKPLIFRREVYR